MRNDRIPFGIAMIGIVDVQVDIAIFIVIPFPVDLAVMDDLRHRVRLVLGRNPRVAAFVDDAEFIHHSNVFGPHMAAIGCLKSV